MLYFPQSRAGRILAVLAYILGVALVFFLSSALSQWIAAHASRPFVSFVRDCFGDVGLNILGATILALIAAALYGGIKLRAGNR